METSLEAKLNSIETMLKTQLNPLILTTKLYDATIKGDLNSLHILLQDDPLILDRCILEKSPLLVATSLGHVEFSILILHLKPELAKLVDPVTRSSALHLASEKGYLDIVKKLIEVSPSMCLLRDEDGRNPVHVAGMSGQLHVLEFLVSVYLYAAQEKTNAGETLLHLCVKHAQVECLKYAVNVMGNLLNAVDNDGNTVLHLAVLAKQPEAVQFLATNKKMQLNTLNKNGLTPMDCLIQSGNNIHNNEIRKTLNRAKAFKAKQVKKKKHKDGKWLDKQRSALMVVASLIATMVFQVGVNPPPYWNKDSNPNLAHKTELSPATSVFVVDAYTDLVSELQIANGISLVASLSVVLLLISGLPSTRLFVSLLMVAMWVAIAGTLFTFVLSLELSLDLDSRVDDTITLTFYTAGLAFILFVGIMILCYILGYLIKPIKKRGKLAVRVVRKWMRNDHHSSSMVP